MPVPAYRQKYFSAFLACAFQNPRDYLLDVPGPLCEEVVLVEPVKPGCDARRWTVEVRFSQAILLDDGLEYMLLPSHRAWGSFDDVILEAAARDVRIEQYDVSDGESAWEALGSACQRYLDEALA